MNLQSELAVLVLCVLDGWRQRRAEIISFTICAHQFKGLLFLLFNAKHTSPVVLPLLTTHGLLTNLHALPHSKWDLCLGKANPMFHSACRLQIVRYFPCTASHFVCTTCSNTGFQCQCVSLYPCHDQERSASILVGDCREKNVWAIMKLTVCEGARPQMTLTMHYLLHMVKLFRHRLVTVIFFRFTSGSGLGSLTAKILVPLQFSVWHPANGKKKIW